jgi:hypothetical protein
MEVSPANSVNLTKLAGVQRAVRYEIFSARRRILCEFNVLRF